MHTINKTTLTDCRLRAFSAVKLMYVRGHWKLDQITQNQSFTVDSQKCAKRQVYEADQEANQT